MMTNWEWLLFYAALLLGLPLQGQSSFSKSVNNIGTAGYIQAVQNGVSFIEVQGQPSPTYSVPIRQHEFDNEGEAIRSIAINSPIDSFGWWFVPSYVRRGDVHLFQAVGWPTTNPLYIKNGLFVINNETGSHWAKRSANGTLRGVLTANEERVSCTRLYTPQANPSADLLGISSFNIADGSPLWEQHYQVDTNLQVAKYSALSMQMTQSGEVYVLGEAVAEPENRLFNFLLHLSSAGEPLRSVAWSPDFRPSNFVLQDEQIFLAGDLPGQPEGFVGKLDANLRWQWGKRVYAENFSYDAPSIYARTDGTLAVICNSRIDPIPLLYAHLDTDGNLLDTFGFAVSTALSTLAPDDGLVAISPNSYDNNANQLRQPYLFKTTPGGRLNNCPTLPACVSMEALSLELNPLDWMASPAPPLPEIEVIIQPWEAYTEDYCGMPQPPSPRFFMPDTICQYHCLEADSLGNALASLAEWTLRGPGVDTTLQQLQFEWCYEEAGEYVLSQTLWFLGCDYTYEDAIVVLPDNLQPPIAAEQLLLCNDTREIELESNRPLASAYWQDGNTSLQRVFSTPGTYHVEASDGYCRVADSVWVRSLAEAYPNPLSLVAHDTLLCNRELPLRLTWSSPFADELFYAEASWPLGTPAVLGEGTHRLGVRVEDCELVEEVTVRTRDCAARLYLPNVFSPNRDGVNDYWTPEGENYQGLSLQVFDRWGGMVYIQKDQPPYRWDGTTGGKELSTGTYLVIFDYWNELLQTTERVSQEVLLLR